MVCLCSSERQNKIEPYNHCREVIMLEVKYALPFVFSPFNSNTHTFQFYYIYIIWCIFFQKPNMWPRKHKVKIQATFLKESPTRQTQQRGLPRIFRKIPTSKQLKCGQCTDKLEQSIGFLLILQQHWQHSSQRWGQDSAHTHTHNQSSLRMHLEQFRIRGPESA